jgi:3-oxoacyl-[acyl-carrier-protein] synthase-3
MGLNNGWAHRLMAERGATVAPDRRRRRQGVRPCGAQPAGPVPARVTIEEVLASPQVAGVLTRLMCSSFTDGAAAVVLAGPGRFLPASAPRIIGSVARSGNGCSTTTTGWPRPPTRPGRPSGSGPTTSTSSSCTTPPRRGALRPRVAGLLRPGRGRDRPPRPATPASTARVWWSTPAAAWSAGATRSAPPDWPRWSSWPPSSGDGPGARQVDGRPPRAGRQHGRHHRRGRRVRGHPRRPGRIRIVTGIRITGWGIAVPDKVVTNDDMAASLDTSDAWITERTGIRERHIGGTTSGWPSRPGGTRSSAGRTAAEIDQPGAGHHHARRHRPGTAPTVQNGLGIKGGAFDLNAACSGFVYGLVTVAGLIAIGSGPILLIGSETSEPDHRHGRPVHRHHRGRRRRRRRGRAGRRSRAAAQLEPELRRLAAPPPQVRARRHLYMDGKEVFRKAVRVVVESAERAMADAGLGPTTSRCSSPTRPTCGSSRRPASGSASPRSAPPWSSTATATPRRPPSRSPCTTPSERPGHDGDHLLLTGFGGGMTWASAVSALGRVTGATAGGPRSSSWRRGGPVATAAASPWRRSAPRRGGHRPGGQRRPGGRVRHHRPGARPGHRSGHPLPREHTWPSHVDVRFALQEAPLGTVHAVLSASDHVGRRPLRRGQRRRHLRAAPPAALLAAHLTTRSDQRAGGLPPGRRRGRPGAGHPRHLPGGDDGQLLEVDERRQVTAPPDGASWSADGREPSELSPDARVSMNLWGFTPAFQARRCRPPWTPPPDASEEAEVLLPEVVADSLAT